MSDMRDQEGCPAPETLAALMDGRLPAALAARVRAHLSDCPVCFEVTREAIHFLSRPEVEGTQVPRPYRRYIVSAVWLSAAAALVLVAGLRLMERTPEDGLAGLATAVGDRRLVEARISGGFAYAPLPSPERGLVPIDRANPRDWKVFEEAGKIYDSATRKDTDPGATHALGLAHLILGNADAAVEILERAARARPGDALTLSDLAAAYLARSDAQRRSDDLVHAIDLARHALTLDPRCNEARFNFALAVEKQLVSGGVDASAAPDPGRAIGAWRDYLSHDTESPWAAEARSHLADLERRSALLPVAPDPAAIEAATAQRDFDRVARLVSGSPRVAREVLERRLLPAWAAAQRDRREEAATRALDAAALLAEAIERASGDRLGVDSVRALAGVRSDVAAAARNAESITRYADSITLYEAGDLRKAAAGFRSAMEALDRGRNPLRWSAALRSAVCDYYAAPGSDVRLRLDRMAAELGGRHYDSLLARVRWMQGLLGAVSGDLSRSLAHYGEALALFERAREFDGVASANFLIAENLDLLGEREEAWRHRARALGLASRADAERRRSILQEAALAALEQDRPWAALTFHEPLFETWSADAAGERSEAFKTRARILAAGGNFDGALADLADAERALAGVGDPDLRRRYAAEISESRGTILLSRSPADAVEPLRQAAEYFASIGSMTRIAGPQLDLGRAHEALGSYAEAERDYGGGIASLEETYSRLAAGPDRVSFVDRTWDLFEAMIRLEAIDRKRPDLAFSYAERARRAELLSPQACAPENGAPLGPDAAAIARALPDNVTVVYLTAVSDRLLRWILVSGRAEFRPQPVSRGEVAGLVRDLRNAAAERNETSFRDAASALYDLLIRPVEALLPSSGEIWFVPDRLLNDVPFAALFDRQSHAFLMERYATGVAPAAASLVSRCLRHEHARASASVLVVGNPALDGGLHADLPSLPGAEAEARRIASLYGASTLLIGTSATAERFLSSIASADIVHFAGHATVNERFPLLSALVLAPDPAGESSDLVTSFDLQRARISRARLVVLGACRAAGGGADRAGSTFNLARPFLAAGVPEIVGTLWAVRDREANGILVDLHREYRRGLSAVEGLRLAQIGALRGPDEAARSPLSWGAYVVNGIALLSGDSHTKEVL